MTDDKPIQNQTPSEGDAGRETPGNSEDVAGLYSWAKMAGSGYRDFSAYRRKPRPEVLGRGEPEERVPVRETENVEEPMAEVREPVAEVREPVAEVREPLGMRAVSIASGPQRGAATAKKQARTPQANARWSALKGVFADATEISGAVEALPTVELELHSLIFVSMAGGVGKTSLVASLGSALAAHGERLLLVDTHTYSLLPLYFGLRADGRGRERLSEADSALDRIHCMTLDRERAEEEQADEHWLLEKVAARTFGMDRVLIDVSTGSASLMRQVLRFASAAIVVLAPDMASVVSLQAVQAFFRVAAEEFGRRVEPYFLLNCFDSSLQLHGEVRGLLTRQLGDRLLPFVIHRSSAVSEALAEGMTVVDYAPETQVVEDLRRLAEWVRELPAQAAAAPSTLRWRER